MRYALPFLFAVIAAGCVTRVTFPDMDPYEASGDWIVDGDEAGRRYAAGALILDARAREDFVDDHIRGAVHVEWLDFSEQDADARGLLLSDDGVIGEKLRALGVSGRRPVLVIGDTVTGWGEDGRIAWMLRTLGHPDAALVDGGYHALIRAGLPRTSGNEDPPTPGDFTVVRDAALSASIEEVAAALDEPDTVLLDVRERREFEGQTPYGEDRGGHLPCAVHLHYDDLRNTVGYLKPRDEILRLLADRGITEDRPVIAYCSGGVRSAWFVVLLKDLGFQDARNYAGSMWEWAAAPAELYPLE